MIDYGELARSASHKLDELAALHWFTQAEKITYDKFVLDEGGFAKEERPDFRLLIGGRVIGVEITLAHRPISDSKFTAKQIEAAQKDFSEALNQSVQPALPIIINLSFNDEIAVKLKEAEAALTTIVAKIDELTREMEPRSGAMLVRTDAELERYPNAHVCAEIPDFLQQIQFYNDGQDFSAVTSSRGGIVENFTESDLDPILVKKHEALKGYRPCDEYWLVIVSGMVPPLFFPKERPNVLHSSVATDFADTDVTLPVSSDFDRVYFFRSPTHALLLTQSA